MQHDLLRRGEPGAHRDIKNTAKRMALMDQAAGGPPDVMTFEEEAPPLTMDEYFGYADDKSLVWN